MNKTFLLIAGLLLSTLLFGQDKTIIGVIYDEDTRKRIAGVEINPSFSDTAILSRENGRFKIILPKKYFDTLVFSHTNYYPFIKRIRKVDNLRPQTIFLIPRSLNLDTICYYAYKENKVLKGIVQEHNTGNQIVNAKITSEDDKVIAYSNATGYFNVVVPRSTQQFSISHPDFKSKTIYVEPNKGNNTGIEVELERKKFRLKDTIWKSYKNFMGMAINELINGGVGLRYQRFIKINHAIGIHSTFYLFGKGNNLYGVSSYFNGIKLAPYYRFYSPRKLRKGVYGEVKAIGGYIDFSQLHYAYSADRRYGDSYSEQFWSYGFGFGGGWFKMLPRTDHAVINLYVGFQYFPMHVPATHSTVNYGELKVDNPSWYLIGPGSYVEIKLIFGGIF